MRRKLRERERPGRGFSIITGCGALGEALSFPLAEGVFAVESTIDEERMPAKAQPMFDLDLSTFRVLNVPTPGEVSLQGTFI